MGECAQLQSFAASGKLQVTAGVNPKGKLVVISKKKLPN